MYHKSCASKVLRQPGGEWWFRLNQVVARLKVISESRFDARLPCWDCRLGIIVTSSQPSRLR
jgi:hypothetical protein